MPPRSVDPARLNGVALMNWYRRSAADIERERQVDETERYRTYFGQRDDGVSAIDIQRDAVQSDQDQSGLLVQGVYRPEDNGGFIEVGNPHNRRLRKEWEKKEGGNWPKVPETGHNYDVEHNKALADGGTNTLENISPMHPDEHRSKHMRDGDFVRWSKRAGIARAFGGTVERTLRAVPYLNFFADILGMASGRIRTDNMNNFVSDMMGYWSEEDWQKYIREHQKDFNPGWKPGDPLMDPRYQFIA